MALKYFLFSVRNPDGIFEVFPAQSSSEFGARKDVEAMVEELGWGEVPITCLGAQNEEPPPRQSESPVLDTSGPDYTSMNPWDWEIAPTDEAFESGFDDFNIDWGDL